jgi:hypothetical protein
VRFLPSRRSPGRPGLEAERRGRAARDDERSTTA